MTPVVAVTIASMGVTTPCWTPSELRDSAEINDVLLISVEGNVLVECLNL